MASLEAQAAKTYVPPYTMALVQAGLGDRDGVFDWLERAYAVRDVHLIYLPVDVKWDPYRSDPRFVALWLAAFTRCGNSVGTVATAASAPDLDSRGHRRNARNVDSLPNVGLATSARALRRPRASDATPRRFPTPDSRLSVP